MSSIPETQTIALVDSPGPNARMVIKHDAPVGRPGAGEVLIKLECTGLCHSDIRAYLGWGPYNGIVGHEGIGVVVHTGDKVDKSLLGARVGIKWLFSACGECSLCEKGTPNNCPKQQNTGKHVPGTLAQYVVGDSRFISRIPDRLSSAMSKLSEMEKGSWVVISGSGGGLGHVGVQLARKHGFQVIAVDSGDSKRKLSIDSGAEVFIDYKTQETMAEVSKVTGEGAHAVIVVPGEEKAFAAAAGMVRNGGAIVCVGLPPNDFNIPIGASLCCARGLTIKGVAVGTEEEMDALLALGAEGKVKSLVEVVDFERIGDVMERLKNNQITGRVVVRLPE